MLERGKSPTFAPNYDILSTNMYGRAIKTVTRQIGRKGKAGCHNNLIETYEENGAEKDFDVTDTVGSIRVDAAFLHSPRPHSNSGNR